MKILKYLFVIGFSFLFFLSSHSQTNDYKVRKCYNYEHDSCGLSENMYYKVHNLSRSALFVVGQTSRTPFKIYNGRDYRISLCWDPILGNRLFFKIYDKATEALLYDNANDEYSTDFEFTVAQTSEVLIEVTVPVNPNDTELNSSNPLIFTEKDKKMGCVGVLVEHMITPTKGF